MDIDKIINIIREQRILKEERCSWFEWRWWWNYSFNLVRSIRQMITDPNGTVQRQDNDPQNYLTDKEYKDRGEFR